MESPLTAKYTPAQLAALRGQNHDYQIFVYVIIFTLLAVLATVVRIWCRHVRKSIGLDDGLVIFAMVLSVAQNIYIAIGATESGVGHHLVTLNKSQFVSFNKLWYTVGLLEPTIMAATKLSILLLFRRIFVQPLFRTCTTIVGVVIALWWFGNFFADALICVPIQKNWRPDLPGHCGNKHLLFILPPIAGIVTDVMLLVMPMTMLRTLHMPKIQRFGLAGLFCLGGFATVASCIRYRTLFFDTKDATYDIVPATIWTVIESNVTIISACLIVSKPFFIKIYPQKLVRLIQNFVTRKSVFTEGTKRNHSSSRWFRPSLFKPLTDTPPAVTSISLGNPFEVDVEKSYERQRMPKEVTQNRKSMPFLEGEQGSF
ncbi:MAG: hypothetical protein Q9201_007480 [Fulgogasparrea decipioides]